MKTENAGEPKAYQMSQSELRAVQLAELEMLKEVHRICEKHSINYCAIGGTALGAIRHKGFIPWDDDIDVAFLRKDYEKFRDVLESELNSENFYFQDQEKTPGYRWGYGKLRRKGTEFIRLGQEHMPYEQGIFIDLMPLDFVPDNYLFRCLHCFAAFLFRKSFWSEVGKHTAKGMEKFIYIILSKIPEKWLKNNFERFVRFSNRKETVFARLLLFPCATNNLGELVEFYKNTGDFIFENFTIKVPKDYEKYLTFIFGNYIELPPENKRKTHPISKLKLLYS
jgi:lipopolysaccharide cholinephosphotransferase